MVLFTLVAILNALCSLQLAVAGPTIRTSLGSITVLSSSQIASYTPYTWYANAGYCEPSSTITWNCGPSCEANSGFIPVASGGDETAVQFWFVGYDPSLDSVVVSHQGTKVEAILPILTDSDIVLEPLSSSLFPGINSNIQVHSGFANEHAKTAADVLSAVQKVMSSHGATHITTVGHSLGAAIALLDSAYLHMHIPDVAFSFVGYGLPRVGNSAFASYLDSLPIPVTHINNQRDVVSILPGRFLGFAHPVGEVHIQNRGEWAGCPGQDNPSGQCIVGDVPTIFEGDVANHDGPYGGITMDSSCSH